MGLISLRMGGNFLLESCRESGKINLIQEDRDVEEDIFMDFIVMLF